MQEIFQKSAKLDRVEALRRAGVLSAATFDDYSSLRAFLPEERLRPLISHYWIVRWNVPPGLTYRPTEVLAAPVVNLFFILGRAFVYGLTTQTLEYEARGRGVMAGATFQPGGFFPYWGKSMAELPAHQTDLTTVFPDATAGFSTRLLARDDEAIARGIEDLVKRRSVKVSPHLATITAIVKTAGLERGVQNVREASARFGIPARTLQHVFRREVGVSLKWVIMRARLLEAVQVAYRQRKPDWVGVALELGYSSQAHFIADFRRATGRSPGAFHRRE